MRRAMMGRKKKLVTKRFYPGGDYTWTVPEGVYEVDVFLVGGGGGAYGGSSVITGGGGSGYTKTFKKSTEGWRDGPAIAVTPGEKISIRVGYRGNRANNGGYSQFKDSRYRADGGKQGRGSEDHSTWQWITYVYGGDGGSGGGAGSKSEPVVGGSDGNAGRSSTNTDYGRYVFVPGKGQGHTTRDFGEPTGKRNAGGGGSYGGFGGTSDYEEGSGVFQLKEENYREIKGRSGGGYGGGAGAINSDYYEVGAGGDGTVLIRYYAYE